LKRTHFVFEELRVGLLFERIELYVKFLLIAAYWMFRLMFFLLRILVVGIIMLVAAIAASVSERRAAKTLSQPGVVPRSVPQSDRPNTSSAVPPLREATAAPVSGANWISRGLPFPPPKRGVPEPLPAVGVATQPPSPPSIVTTAPIPRIELSMQDPPLEPHEIRTVEEFEAMRALGRGVLVITDTPTDKVTAHRPGCRSVRPQDFAAKVIDNQNHNGRYYYFLRRDDAERDLDAVMCRVCVP
jgi:hypothetical protein